MYAWTKNDHTKPEVQGPLGELENVWYRQVDAMEVSFCLSHLFAPGMSDTIVSIQVTPSDPSTKITIETVRAAMRELRFDQPSIAFNHGWRVGTTFQGMPNPKDAFFVYKVPGSEAEVDAWLSGVVLDFSDSSNGDVDAAVQAAIHDAGKRGDHSQPLFSVRYVPSSTPTGPHGFVFRTSHAIFDGIGAWQIADLFVDKLAGVIALGDASPRNLAWGDEHTRLPAPFVAASRIPYDTPRIQEDSVMVGKVTQAVSFFKDSYGLPVLKPEAAPGTTGYISRKLPTDVVTALRDAARTNGCSIFSLVYAAMALTGPRINPPSETRLKTEIAYPCVIAPVDLRHLITDDPYDKSQWKARLAIGYAPYTAHNLERYLQPDAETDKTEQEKKLVKSIWAVAKEIAVQLEEYKKYSERAAVWTEEVLWAAMTSTAPTNAPPTTALQHFSSIGVIDRYLTETHPISTGGHLTVSSPRMTTTYYMVFGGYSIVFQPFTFKGELFITFSFPELAMGTEAEQLKAFEEGKRVSKGDASTVVVEYVEEYMNTLRTVAKLAV